MKPKLMLTARIVGFTLGLCAFAGSAMALDLGGILGKVKSDFAAINEKGEQDRARIRGNGQPNEIAKSAQSETIESNPPKLVIPKDKRVAVAMEEALPTIKKVLSLHQCMQDWQSLRQLNVFAVPGLDMTKRSGMIPSYAFPNSHEFMKFHDRNKCVSVTTIDSWSMPALNALLFRAVYFAEDSGETVNFLYLLTKVSAFKNSEIINISR